MSDQHIFSDISWIQFESTCRFNCRNTDQTEKNVIKQIDKSFGVTFFSGLLWNMCHRMKRDIDCHRISSTAAIVFEELKTVMD